MSLSGAHKAAFRREAVREGRIFSIRDTGGHPAPAGPDGARAVPFWSKSTRADRVAGQVGAFHGLEIVTIALDDWLAVWLPELARADLLVGVNWAGARATGFDLTPVQVAGWFESPDRAEAGSMQMAGG
jgi:uncharacterized protein DUF2750